MKPVLLIILGLKTGLVGGEYRCITYFIGLPTIRHRLMVGGNLRIRYSEKLQPTTGFEIAHYGFSLPASSAVCFR